MCIFPGHFTDFMLNQNNKKPLWIDKWLTAESDETPTCDWCGSGLCWSLVVLGKRPSSGCLLRWSCSPQCSEAKVDSSPLREGKSELQCPPKETGRVLTRDLTELPERQPTTRVKNWQIIKRFSKLLRTKKRFFVCFFGVFKQLMLSCWIYFTFFCKSNFKFL